MAYDFPSPEWASAYKDAIVFAAIVPVLLLRSLTDRHRDEED